MFPLSLVRCPRNYRHENLTFKSGRENSAFEKLIMRHIFLTGHGNHEVLFCLCDRLWPQFFGTKHCGHSSHDSARAWNFAGGVVAPDMRKTELAQSQR